MSTDALKDYFLKKLKTPALSGMEGARIAFHIPVQEDFVNFVLQTLIADPDAMNDFEEVHFSEMDNDEFRVKINHAMIDKNLRCRIHDIEYNCHSERVLKIEFLEGIKFYEKALLSIYDKAKSGWSSFKNALKSGDDDEDGSDAFWKISGSKVKINLDALLRKLSLAFLIPMADWKGIITKNNTIIFNFELKATQNESNYPENN
ncbi:MAG: hypothetical protein ACQETJ_07005 [Bacteroidota bacterium]